MFTYIKNDVRLHCIGHFADCIYVLLTYMCRYPHFQIVYVNSTNNISHLLSDGSPKAVSMLYSPCCVYGTNPQYRSALIGRKNIIEIIYYY